MRLPSFSCSFLWLTASWFALATCLQLQESSTAGATIPTSFEVGSFVALLLILFFHACIKIFVARLLGYRSRIFFTCYGMKAEFEGGVSAPPFLGTTHVVKATQEKSFAKLLPPLRKRVTIHLLSTSALWFLYILITQGQHTSSPWEAVVWHWFMLQALPIYPQECGIMLTEILWTFFGRMGARAGACISFAAVFAYAISCFHSSSHMLFVDLIALFSLIPSYRLLKEADSYYASYALPEEERLLASYEEAWKMGQQKSAIQQLCQLAAAGLNVKTRQRALALGAQYLCDLSCPREAFELLTSPLDPLDFNGLSYFAISSYLTSHWKQGLLAARQLYDLRQHPATAILAAVFSARAYQPKESASWLWAAAQLGNFDVSRMCRYSDFDSVREHPHFARIIHAFSHFQT